MRTQYSVSVLLFVVTAALAQEKPLISTPAPNLWSRSSASIILDQALSRSFTHHAAYWEDNAGTGAPPNPSAHLTRQYAGNKDDFSPGKLVWNFNSKHKLVPVLDLTVIKLNPTQPWSLQNGAVSEFGTFVSQHKPGDLVNKAAQSLMSAMHR